MTREEALMLITYASEKWGGAAAFPTDPTLLAIRVEVWMDALSDVDAALVRSLLAEARDEFPPNVAVLRRRADELTLDAPALPSWDEFWPWVRSIACRCTDFLPERSGGESVIECPWPALDGLINVPMVAGWARDGLTEHDLELIVQAHMRRLFEARTTRLARSGISLVPALAEYKQRLDSLTETIGHRGELDSA